MSHPPETSLSSRELARTLFTYEEKHRYRPTLLDDWTALIEAWVQVREAAAHAEALRIFREQYQAAMMDTGGDREAATYCGLQAVERMTPADVVKQREETP